MSETEITNKNIVRIFRDARKALDKIAPSGVKGAWIFTPYGEICIDEKNKITGNKKAVAWVKRLLK